MHARNFRGTFYGLVAGFLEAGEHWKNVWNGKFLRNGAEGKEHHLLQQPALAPSQRIDGGFHCRLRKREIKLQEDEADRCRLLFQRQPARNSTKTEYRKKADRLVDGEQLKIKELKRGRNFKKQIAEKHTHKRTTTNETTLIHINQSVCNRNLHILNFPANVLFINHRV